jgi:hypothetical protein
MVPSWPRCRAPRKPFSGPEFICWLSDEAKELASIVEKIGRCIQEELSDSMGKPGEAGDAIKMLRTVDALFGYCRVFLAFELDVCAADPPSKLKMFGATFRGITLWGIDVVEQLTREWSQSVEGLRRGSHQFQVNLKVQSIPQLQKALAETDKVRKNPEMYF